MSQLNEQNKSNAILDLDKSNKNEEDLLSFSSKYKATLFKEEDIQENIRKKNFSDRKISGDSTSFSISHEYSNLSINSRKINNIKFDEILNSSAEFNESKKQYQERQRKMSSPLCFYFDGSDAVLSKTHSSYIDLNNSLNFVKKESLFGGSTKLISRLNKNTIINKEIKPNLNYNLNSENNEQNEKSLYKENVNNKSEKNKRLSFNDDSINRDLNYNYISQQNINNNFLYLNNFQQQLFKMNYMNLNNLRNNLSNNNRKLSYNIEDSIIGNYFNNILNLNNACQQIQGNYNPVLFSFNETNGDNPKCKNHKNLNNKASHNAKKQSDKKRFDKRKGDWLCPECHNLNFAFRIVCNRCQLPKTKIPNADTIINNEN